MTRLLAFLFILLFVPGLACAALAVKEFKTPKGISVWLEEDQSQPVVSISFAWRGGFENDPDKLQGLSTLAADMLTHGAGTYDDNAFQKALQENSISLDVDARRDANSGGIRFLKQDINVAGDLLRAAITAPRFDKDALERQKEQAISRLKFNLADPDWLLLRLTMREGFKDHPYGKRALGTPASLKAIIPADLKGWQKNLARENLVVAATGAINEQELGALLDKVFGELPPAPPVSTVPEAVWSIGGKNFLLKMPGPQAQLLLEWPGLKRDDPDYYTGEVMDYILGGGSFSSRLMKEIREKRGLTYGVSSGQSPLDHAALYTVQASFQAKNAGEVLRLVGEEVKRIGDAPVTPEELQEAKDYLIGAYPLQLTSSTAISSHLLHLRLDHLPMDEEDRRAKAINATTAADVQRIAKKLFAAPPAVFMVGTPEGVKFDQSFDTLD